MWSAGYDRMMLMSRRQMPTKWWGNVKAKTYTGLQNAKRNLKSVISHSHNFRVWLNPNRGRLPWPSAAFPAYLPGRVAGGRLELMYTSLKLMGHHPGFTFLGLGSAPMIMYCCRSVSETRYNSQFCIQDTLCLCHAHTLTPASPSQL